jgi:hypothetical protein
MLTEMSAFGRTTLMNETVYLFALSLPDLLDRIVADREDVRVPVPQPPSPVAPGVWRGVVELNRRDTTRRAEVVRTVLEEIVHGGIPFVPIAGLRDSLQVSPEAATRIVERLVSAGVLIETGEGVWTRVAP